MSFFKFTSLVGRDRDGQIITASRNGHWKPETAAKVAAAAGMVGAFEMRHSVGDLSGKGRGGHDGRFVVQPDGSVEKRAAWSEFGKEHA